MMFYPKGLLALVACGALVVLAVNARAGRIDPSLAVVGMTAILAVEAALFFGFLRARRPAVHDAFIRSGLFSLRPLPRNQAERELEAPRPRVR